ncbi:HNH endonuclease [Shewanella algae]|uniref:HNH endonuclease n=1 Tax=Shewanella algae TaxID=38313 RepID=UPI00313C8FE5
MKLSVDLSALHRAVAPLGKVVTDFTIVSRSTELESVAEDLIRGMILGRDIQLSEIDSSDGILNYQGHQVMLYIPDQGDDIRAVLVNGEEGRRIHVAECSTLEFMRQTGRFGRYDVISRIDGKFPVFGQDVETGQNIEGESNLGVCKNCLRVLNFKGYESSGAQRKNEIFSSFSFEKFFEAYSSYFKNLPSGKANTVGSYTPDWASISSKLRAELDYTCEQCGVNLAATPKLLHVHHISGNKADNSRSNLRALCADCHKKQPHHGHLHVSNSDTLTINQLRREQHKFDVFDYNNVLRCADSALEGLLIKCEATALAGPELGIAINDTGTMVSIDLCWPRRKVAVVIDMSKASVLRKYGWTVFSAFEALNNYAEFQAKVR